MALPGVGISLADALYEKGFYSAEEIGKASVEDLLQIRGIDAELAASLIESARLQAEQAAAEAQAEAAGRGSRGGGARNRRRQRPGRTRRVPRPQRPRRRRPTSLPNPADPPATAS
ncbi:MAG: helix-hairpin-helix domain-containing protein [Desulfobacterales bacterium]|nr:helix-hairpin-helix domain-containing protein [Desulfobacterales bacterium]